MENLTAILDAARRGSREATEQLFQAVQAELRRIASAQMRGQPRNHTLQTSALVNEAYLRMAPDGESRWEDRAHFFGTAAKAMRSILVDMARQRAAQKRGGARARVSLQDGMGAVEPNEEVIAVHDALNRLAKMDARGARIVELRFFAGLPIEETARVLDLSERTVRRGWDDARAWLYRELKR